MGDSGGMKACRYRINTMRLDVGGSSYEVDPRMVSEIVIDKPYEEAYFPYFEITFSVPNNTYRAMRENNVEIRCYIDLQKGFDNVTMNDEQKTNSADLAWETAIEGTFYCYSSDGTPATNKEQVEQVEESEGLNNAMDLSNMTTTRIALYNEEYLFNSKQTVNGVLQNVDSTSALAWVCQNSGMQNILLSPATNMDPIEQLVVPPYNSSSAIDYIANNYQMHDCGSLVFFDMNRGYILNKNATTSAWAEGDSRTTHIQSVQNASSSYGSCCGCAIQGSDIVVNMEENSLKFTTPSAVQTQKTGSNMRIVDAETGSFTDVETGATTPSMGQNTKVYTNQTGNVSDTALQTAVKEASKQIEASFTAVDISAFDPNKEIIFDFTDPQYTEYGGSYRCSGMKCYMQLDGDTFVPYIQATFVGGYE